MKISLIRCAVLLLVLLPAVHGSSQRTTGIPNSRGAALYQKHCAACHQSDGAGVPRLIPPLVGTDYVSGDKSRLIRILLNGLNEPIVVQDEEYFSPMASFSFLSDSEIAHLLSYVRSRFGKGASPVKAKEVLSQRKKPVK